MSMLKGLHPVQQQGVGINNNYDNTADLKELMAAPPMSAEEHAAVLRKRNQSRRNIEEARERRQLELDDPLADVK